jgi:transcriptional regulator with XRE-family HTH domain
LGNIFLFSEIYLLTLGNILHIIGFEVIEVYRLLTQRRIALDMTIEELSEKSKVPKTTVAKIMSGITPDPRVSSLKSIAHTLGLTLDDLAEYERNQNVANMPISAEALQFALNFDNLDEEGKRLARGFMLMLKENNNK